MKLEALNQLSLPELEDKLEQCCAASKWFKNLAAEFPFSDQKALENAADKIWSDCSESDYLEAFLGHPKIGDVNSLAKKFEATKQWAGNEQELVDGAAMDVIEALAQGNADYEARFGFIFIVFATGKTAKQMLDLLLKRLPNDRASELKIAAAEQHKITKLRIQKLLA
ncbi:2-oxo-4-hydroxy-4-carboxy-5-ureidoimidazoline decarboxylase [Aureispira anguillae]|uniref:2-oxo-4-hydroxy-4-carboxy-5-ureidoimidazoline decarboxylase n=1 Tax=Aureispira anguillae TaxID=2864201 RepID=A0A915YDX2_9BACT|nr:2-oxo-4-hydroxy-4-carboxy-5-ureidoimidazoline decarboxylase [Aureispira anguillae]BDS11308.1 2-oxo-4-hydroxy-4-carboxy-5-ureidoimidazoline decarboxylase [Aureispira anguillae]